MRAEGEYTGGHCHTYNPTTNSFADEAFYAMLGKYAHNKTVDLYINIFRNGESKL